MDRLALGEQGRYVGETTAEMATEQDLEHYRVALTGYCYRMLGSAFEAEDAVQETMLRAWRNLDSFEGRSSLKNWLFRIATNVCLNMVDKADRKRVRPVDFGPIGSANVPIGPKRPEVPWLEPIPDALVVDTSADPAEVITQRETIRLAFVAALQHLPAKQRAALILCDVFRWKAGEAAKLLESSEPSINSALQRARAALPNATFDHQQPLDQLSAQYAQSFQRYDMDAIVAMLRDDVVMSMPPYDLWLQGPVEVRTWLKGQGYGCEGSALVATWANGTAAFGQYRIDPAGGYAPWALQVIDFAHDHVAAITSFLDTPELFPLFDLPAHLDSEISPSAR